MVFLITHHQPVQRARFSAVPLSFQLRAWRSAAGGSITSFLLAKHLTFLCFSSILLLQSIPEYGYMPAHSRLRKPAKGARRQHRIAAPAPSARNLRSRRHRLRPSADLPPRTGWVRFLKIASCENRPRAECHSCAHRTEPVPALEKNRTSACHRMKPWRLPAPHPEPMVCKQT